MVSRKKKQVQCSPLGGIIKPCLVVEVELRMKCDFRADELDLVISEPSRHILLKRLCTKLLLQYSLPCAILVCTEIAWLVDA